MFEIQELITRFNPQNVYIYLIIICMTYSCYYILLLSMVNDRRKWKFYIYIFIIICAMYTIHYFKHDVQLYILMLYRELREII